MITPPVSLSYLAGAHSPHTGCKTYTGYIHIFLPPSRQAAISDIYALYNLLVILRVELKQLLDLLFIRQVKRLSKPIAAH